MNLFRKKVIENDEAVSQLQVDFDCLNEKYGDLQSKYLDSENLTATLNTQIVDMQAEINNLKIALANKDDELAQLATLSANVQEQAANKAVEILASSGVEPVETLEEPKSLLDELKSLKGKEQADFYNKNKAEIFKLLNR